MAGDRQKKIARFFSRFLILIPTAYQDYDANHISIVYFCELGLRLLGETKPDRDIAAFVDELWTGCGYRASTSYEPNKEATHIPSTYFCLCLRKMLGLPPLSETQAQAIRDFIPQCQSPSGLFRATTSLSGEASVRHSYTAHAVWKLLEPADSPASSDLPEWIGRSLEYISRCQTFEGGLGNNPDDEAHLGLTYCGVAALRMHDALHRLDVAAVRGFVERRQQPNGGFNGRPNKNTDVCYSFWALGTLACLDALPNEAAAAAAVRFIEDEGYDSTFGGFRKSPESTPDPYHTALTLCALSILDSTGNQLQTVDPVLCVTSS